MYLGRIVAVGLTKDGRATAMYRVSSRSFPNREAVINNEVISILPRPGFESDLRKNPYISYNCVRIAKRFAVASNGSHTDPIVEKIAMGYPVRDAVTLGLLAMDYEKDSLDTPRIVAVAELGSLTGHLGIVRKDAVLYRSFEMTPGYCYYLSTYQCDRPCGDQFDPHFVSDSADDAAQYVISGGVFANFEKPVTSAVAFANGDNFDYAVKIV